MRDHSARRWIGVALVVQCLGYVVDAVWHGWLSPGVEPRTLGEMARHLGTVHLALYLGAAGVLFATSRGLVRDLRRAGLGVAQPIAVAGSLLTAGAEAWHAYAHLRLDTHGAPIAGSLSVVGFLVVVITMAVSGRTRRRRTEAARGRRVA